MDVSELDGLLADLPPRRVLVVSDRYPPDAGGGAERSLHLMLREPLLRDQVLVVAFDKALATPIRRDVDGVVALALPAPAAWPLDGLAQAEVDRLKTRPFGPKWRGFLGAALGGLRAGPGERLAALALHLAARPDGGLAMDHRTVPGGAMEAAVARIANHVRPELVHADNARAVMVAAGALAGHPVPLIAAVRDHRFTSRRFDQSTTPETPGETNLGARAGDRFAGRALAFRQERLGCADLALVAGAHLAEALAEVLPHGRLLRLPLTPISSKPIVPEPATGFNVLIVGSLTPNKGQERFIEDWPKLLALVPHATLDIAGDGPSAAPLRRRIAALDLQRSVRLHGRVGEPALDALYDGAHVVALPTVWSEPFGRVPLEAGAAGRPVVATAVGGHAETVVDGVTGRLVAPGDGAGFVAALVALAGDGALRAQLGQGGRTRAADYAPATLAAGLLAAWDEGCRTAHAKRLSGTMDRV